MPIFRATDKTLSQENFESNVHRLLSFYYTLFENMNLNSDFIHFIEYHNNPICTFKQLKKASSHSFKGFKQDNPSILSQLPIDITSLVKSEVLFHQFLTIYQFWKKDHSEDKEATDAFIEKSVRLTNDLAHALPTESILDYGKFLFKHVKQFR